ncbi:hypothetical protein ILUMI_04242 [Ignelater luminosus]|uniref:Uncharacterized protein n=1 Tax=Ignelater luminosus TaxID=2038154 RepID=A0A8K0GLD7_IGNLU|nr:hypothetical protein ILUMI_04242 [Ignelater luminosus]
MDVCREHGKNSFGTFDVFDYTNQTFICPLDKGYYYVEGYRPDETKWPTFIPGDYKVDLNITYKGDTLARLAWYLTLIKYEEPEDS